MLAYHRTDHAEAILREGFKDAEGTYLTPVSHRGVWVSAEWPLGANEGAKGDTVVKIDIPESLFAEYESVEDFKGYREALIPAAQLNGHLSTLRVLSDEEIDSLIERRFESQWRAADS